MNNTDDEDYLSMGSSTAEVAPAATSATQSKSKPNVTAAKPFKRASVTAAFTKARSAYNPTASQPGNDEVEDDDEVKPGKGKKIALKSVQEHQNLMNQLNAFSCSVRFGPVLKECGIVVKDLRLKSVAELRELRERVRACCASSGSGGGIVSTGILGACGQMEAWAPPRLMNLEGYRAAVESNSEFASLCEMIEIDSSFISSMSPIQKMVVCLGTTAMTVAGVNRTKGEACRATASLVDNLRMQQQQQQQGIAKGENPAVTAASSGIKPVLPPKPAENGIRSY